MSALCFRSIISPAFKIFSVLRRMRFTVSSPSYSTKDKKSYVVLSDNGKIIVCWHPEEIPPYEHTKMAPHVQYLVKDHTLGYCNFARSSVNSLISCVLCGYPLPVMDPQFNEEDSVLKVQYRRDAKNRFQPDGPTIKELAKLTYTTKHRWYPNNEKKYEDPNPPRDRKGI